MSAPASAIDLDLYRADLAAYAENELWIRTKQAELVPFRFNRAQRIVHEKLSKQMRETGRVRAIVLKARQEGISTYTAARFYRRVNLYEHQNALVIADQRKRGQVLFGIYELYDRKMREEIRPARRSSRRGWELYYDTFDGSGLNSRLQVETAMDAAAGRGSTIQAVHASELAFWEQNPEETWTALMQAVPDIGSEVLIESTANGVGNMFHQMWQDAEAGDSPYLPIFLPWWIHEEYDREVDPDEIERIVDSLTDWETDAMEEGFEYEGEVHKLSISQIAWRRATIRDKLRGDESVFRQEYPSTAREAFLVSGNCYFDEDILLEMERKVRKPRRFHLTEKGGAVVRAAMPRGELRVWADPEPDGQYVIFVDTATGKRSGSREGIYAESREQGGRDFSCAWVYDVGKNAYVAKLHGRIVPEVFAKMCYQLGFLYSHRNPRTGNNIPALLAVERNHRSGETVVRILKEDLDYPNLFFDRQLNKRRNRMTQAAGFVSTEAKRTVMLDDFAAWIREQAGSLPDADTIRECFTFIRGDDGKPEAQEGCHDDRVIAAAGCLQIARHHHVAAVTLTRTPIRRGGAVGHIEYDEEERDAQAHVVR